MAAAAAGRALRATVGRLRGSFSVAAAHAEDPEGDRGRPPGGPARGGARRSGLLASDIPALLGRTRRLFALDDDQLAELGRVPCG